MITVGPATPPGRRVESGSIWQEAMPCRIAWFSPPVAVALDPWGGVITQITYVEKSLSSATHLRMRAALQVALRFGS